jgi:glutamate 5-kinase
MGKAAAERLALLDCEALERIKNAKRVVVKLGTRVLVANSGRPEMSRVKAVVDELARLHRKGLDVIVVSSGAIGAGMDALGMKRRPTSVPDLQMTAAVGQMRLMHHYEELFHKNRCKVGQVLLTHDDLKHRQRHLNARNAINNLLRHRIIPIINENDVVAVDEIKFGDNDVLGALTALLLEADLLLLLSTTNGVRRPSSGNRTERIKYIERIDDQIRSYIRGKGSELSTGGMETKLAAVDMVAEVGAAAVIADGRKPQVIRSILAGEDIGTRIGGLIRSQGSINSKKRWIAFFNKTQGGLVVDDGAVDALSVEGHSLLPIGIRKVEGDFEIGAVVAIRNRRGDVVAKGMSSYCSDDIKKIRGRKTSEISRILGNSFYDEVVHRDNMVVLHKG